MLAPPSTSASASQKSRTASDSPIDGATRTDPGDLPPCVTRTPSNHPFTYVRRIPRGSRALGLENGGAGGESISLLMCTYGA